MTFASTVSASRQNTYPENNAFLVLRCGPGRIVVRGSTGEIHRIHAFEGERHRGVHVHSTPVRQTIRFLLAYPVA